MSNKIVPGIYRAVIDDVMASVKVDFEEYGMEEEILLNLQSKWEARLLETRVADFGRAGSASEGSDSPNTKYEPSSPPLGGPGQSHYQYSRPGMVQQGVTGPGAGAVGANGFVNGGVQPGTVSGGTQGEVRVKAEPLDDMLRLRGGATSDSSKLEPNAAGLLPGDDVIDSDLDDSDDELRGDVEAEDDNDVDIVFCVYDKVQRVKNKWKTVFKDGMIHINGKDYLFSKCNGEFEW